MEHVPRQNMQIVTTKKKWSVTNELKMYIFEFYLN